MNVPKAKITQHISKTEENISLGFLTKEIQLCLASIGATDKNIPVSLFRIDSRSTIKKGILFFWKAKMNPQQNKAGSMILQGAAK